MHQSCKGKLNSAKGGVVYLQYVSIMAAIGKLRQEYGTNPALGTQGAPVQPGLREPAKEKTEEKRG